MITLTRPAYYDEYRYAQYCGLEKDDKSIISANNGDEYYEIDTAKFYRYNEASHEWIEQPSDAAPIDTGLPPMTSETVGHFLSNDGTVTNWQPVASKNFVIGLTEHVDNGTYTADKTWVEIKTAYDELQNIVIRHDSAEMPLMNVQLANNGDATFLFGHVEIQTGGQRIVTRGIQYSHIGVTDTWSDYDMEADLSEYLQLAGGNMQGALTLAGAPTEDNHAATKQYVDTRNLEVQFRQDTTAGILTNVEIGEITQAFIEHRIVTATFNGDVYTLLSASAADASFVHVEDNIVTVLRYDSVGQVWTKEQTTLLDTKGGTMSGNIDMAANNIINAQKIHIDGQANLYLGSVAEKAGTTGARLTGVVGGGAAFVKPDKQSEYVPVSVGTPTASEHAVNLGHLTQPLLSDAPASDGCISNKKYVDDQVATRVPLVQANQGQIKAYVQNGSKPDVCLVSDGGVPLCMARYTTKGHLIDQTAPTENNHLANKQYVDTKVSQTGGNISGDLMVGGSLTINGTGSVLGAPTQNVDIVNKGYLDTSISDVIRKSSVTVGANSSVNVLLSNGAYLLTVSDDMHGGLVFVSVYPSGETINGLVNLNNWKCERISSGSGVTLTNSATSEMTVYITSIGEGTYR
nr:MAG TPA: hyaluronase tail fiber protein [Caudoviricetes sp.]